MNVLLVEDEVGLADVLARYVGARGHKVTTVATAQGGAKQAFASFFRKSNLVALRQLALKRTAERVTKQVRAFGDDHGIARAWAVHERVLVCIGPSPQSAFLIQAAQRLAARLDAQWYAAFVESPSFASAPQADRACVAEHLALAERMGGIAVRLRGTNVYDEVLALARREHITQLVVGKPLHPLWMDRVYGSFLDDLIRNSGDINVYVIGGERPASAVQTRADHATCAAR